MKSSNDLSDLHRLAETLAANDMPKTAALISQMISQIDENPCIWEYDEFHEMWDTSCGNAHIFVAGDVKENNYTFCPYCGRKIQLK